MVEDRFEILRTLNQYAHAVDYGKNASELTDCFIETGVWRSSVDEKFAGTTGMRHQGHKQIERWFMKHVDDVRGAPGSPGSAYSSSIRPMKHVYTNPEIQIDGDRATVESYYLVPEGNEKGPYLHSFGRYEDTLVRCPDGRWRFEERHLHREGTDPEAQAMPVGGLAATARPTVG